MTSWEVYYLMIDIDKGVSDAIISGVKIALLYAVLTFVTCKALDFEMRI